MVRRIIPDTPRQFLKIKNPWNYDEHQACTEFSMLLTKPTLNFFAVQCESLFLLCSAKVCFCNVVQKLGSHLKQIQPRFLIIQIEIHYCSIFTLGQKFSSLNPHDFVAVLSSAQDPDPLDPQDFGFLNPDPRGKKSTKDWRRRKFYSQNLNLKKRYFINFLISEWFIKFQHKKAKK